MENFRILIVDNVLATREGLVSICSKVPGVEVVDSCGNKTSAISAIRNQNYDLAMVELQLDLESGIIVAHELMLVQPSLKVIVYTRSSSRSMTTEILRLGYQKHIQNWIITGTTLNDIEISPNSKLRRNSHIPNRVFGFMLLKNINRRNLEQKLSLVRENSRVVDREISSLLMEQTRHSVLTPREYQCSLLVSKALSNREIALTLGITLQAVEKLINSLYNKLSIGGDPKDPGRRVLLALKIQQWNGQKEVAV